MSTRITASMSFMLDKGLKRLAERVCRAYPEHFSHIDLDNVAFMSEITYTDSGAAAICKKVDHVMRDLLASYRKPTDWVIAFFSHACDGKSQQWMQLVMFHELHHIGEDGKLKDHDIEDFREVLHMAGIDWGYDEDKLPDIIRRKIRLVA